MNINNKIKQFFGGNWSSNKFTKKHTEIPKSFGYEEPKNTTKKKKKKKSLYRWARTVCPFCDADLKVIGQEDRFSWSKIYADECECGAVRCTLKKDHQDCVICMGCPCCHRETWFKDGIYKHQGSGCGFEGEKLKRRE